MFGNKNEMCDRTGISKVLPNLRNIFTCTTSVTLVCYSQLYMANKYIMLRLTKYSKITLR